ncbi:MBL fold metallo-hydrolase [Candidatus Parcubacteria bacterium]|jgi:competence protein ComEC|nr:MBL fold metallo-hydrolase [Candidatus Parcubacteria bacterium]MBT3948791.1 MBL fold metallo-hydrolase [Candidatus Parcubacteria bacterium]
MKKLQITLLLIIIIVAGMLFFIKHNKVSEDISNDIIQNNDMLRITFLDIGQGDATFIEFPNGEQMLVDCAEDGKILEALGRVMPYYDRDIDYLMITHPDFDHYGGCQEVLGRFEVKNIIHNGMKKEYDSMWQSFWWAKENEGAAYFEIEKEDVWNISSTTLHFLYPDHSIAEDSGIPGYDGETNTNDTSVVFKLVYGESSILLTGDAEEHVEEYLISIYEDQLDIDVLKLGHHGSDSSSIQEFIAATSPEHAIASCGLDNKFGHPSRRVLRRLERVSSTIWRTDLQGDVLLEMTPYDINVSVK